MQAYNYNHETGEHIPSASELLSGRMTLCMGCGRQAKGLGRICGRLGCAYTALLPLLRVDAWSGTTTAQAHAWAWAATYGEDCLHPAIRSAYTAERKVH